MSPCEKSPRPVLSLWAGSTRCKWLFKRADFSINLGLASQSLPYSIQVELMISWDSQFNWFGAYGLAEDIKSFYYFQHHFQNQLRIVFCFKLIQNFGNHYRFIPENVHFFSYHFLFWSQMPFWISGPVSSLKIRLKIRLKKFSVESTFCQSASIAWAKIDAP